MILARLFRWRGWALRIPTRSLPVVSLRSWRGAAVRGHDTRLLCCHRPGIPIIKVSITIAFAFSLCDGHSSSTISHDGVEGGPVEMGKRHRRLTVLVASPVVTVKLPQISLVSDCDQYISPRQLLREMRGFTRRSTQRWKKTPATSRMGI